MLDCDPGLLRHAELSPSRTWKHKPSSGASRLTAVPEIEIDTFAESDSRGEGTQQVKARWQVPETMTREEFGVDPANLRIVGVSGGFEV